MSYTVKTFDVATDNSGGFTETVRVKGQLVAAWVEPGDLGTFDLEVSDATAERTLYEGEVIEALFLEFPDFDVEGVIWGEVTVAISNAEPLMTGTVRLMVNR